MNKELIEKLSAIRQYLMALQALAEVGDAKKLADLVNEKWELMWSNYQELDPYMLNDQKTRALSAFAFPGLVYLSLRTGKDHLTPLVPKRVPLMIADLDDLAKKLEGDSLV